MHDFSEPHIHIVNDAPLPRTLADVLGEGVPLAMGQVDYREATTVTVICKYCGSSDVIKYGSKEGVQRFLCKSCGRRFVANNALPGMRYPPEPIASALNAYYEGLSLNEVCRQLQHDYGVSPSDSTVYEWVVRFSRQAVGALRGLRFDVGSTWVVDETVLNIDGKNAWFWDIISEPDRFLVASHLTMTRNMHDAVTVIERGRFVAMKPPKIILSDGLRAYPDAVDRVFGADSKHVRSQGFASAVNTNLVERFHGTLKQRTKVMRGMQNVETARLMMDGWLIHYNFFRPHETLKGKTPGEVIGAKYPFHTWSEVVKDGHIPTEKRETVRIEV